MHRTDNLNHLHSLTVLKSGSLNLLEPLGPVQTYNEIALPFLNTISPIIILLMTHARVSGLPHSGAKVNLQLVVIPRGTEHCAAITGEPLGLALKCVVRKQNMRL